MNRDAMVIYLRDVRDLEVARRCLQQRIEQELDEARAQAASLRNVEPMKIPRDEPPTGIGKLLGAIVVFALTAFLAVLLLTWDLGFFFEAFCWFCLIIFDLFAIGFISEYREAQEKYSEWEGRVAQIRAYNREIRQTADEREQQAVAVEEAWAARERELKAELDQVDGLLDEYYALNVLPNQYRKLSCVCYIYDYMSSSKATLEDTLMHEHMENGFQRLEKKLDQVIAAVEEQVYETRCLRAENREQAQRLARQDQLQLKLLERTERDAAEAAEYAELAACNTRAAALFAAADYFGD